jgi:hypothetical protein
MPGSESIYRTVFQVEVFSEGPFFSEGGDDDPFDLESIHYAIVEGDCIGNVERVSEEIVPAENLRDELIRIGNDGEFFAYLDEEDDPDFDVDVV